MPNALFAITLNGSTDHYLTAGFGNLVDVLAMLYRTEHERDNRLGHEKMLFKPLDAEIMPLSCWPFKPSPGPTGLLQLTMMPTTLSLPSGQLMALEQ